MSETHGIERDHFTHGFDCGQMFPGFQHHPRDADTFRLRQRLPHQGISPLAALLGFEVIGLIEEDRVDLVFHDEFLNCDRLGQLHVGVIDVLIGDLDVLAFLVLVTLRDLLPGNLYAFGITKSFVGHLTHVLLMEVVKRKLVSARSAEDRNRNGNERETDVALPNSSHLASSPLRAVYSLQSNINLQGLLRRRSKGDSMIVPWPYGWPAPQCGSRVRL